MLTDVHEDTPLAEVAAVVDVIQTPAFLCRQTNFIRNAATQGKPVNIKKGQFLSPWEMKNVVEKAASTGNQQILVCERGFSFGYNNLVVDMRGLAVDARHRLPGGVRRHALGAACRAARARARAGSASSFRCSRAPRWRPACRASSWKRTRSRTRRCATGRTRGRSRMMKELLETLVELDRTVKKKGFVENESES